MKVMYWPNEPVQAKGPALQVGGRRAFEHMKATGKISQLEIFSYRTLRHEMETQAQLETLALERLAAFAPDILFVQHVTLFGFSAAFWPKVRQAIPSATIVCHEGDPYDRFSKRVDSDLMQLFAVSDLVTLIGLGSLFDVVKPHVPSAAIRYVPHCYDKTRFGKGTPDKTEKTHDLVMIGNRGTRKRLKFLYVPGGRRRADFARKLSDEHGKRFALYGAGWDGLDANMGLLPFDRQESAIQSAKISVNWDHFDDISYYFSDRLPISLAAGVPHVTSAHRGYDILFSDCPGLYYAESVDEGVDCVRWLLSRPDDELKQEGLDAREWVSSRYEANIVFERAIDLAVEVHNRVAPGRMLRAK